LVLNTYRAPTSNYLMLAPLQLRSPGHRLPATAGRWTTGRSAAAAAASNDPGQQRGHRFVPVAASDRSAALARLVDRDASDDHPGDPAAA
jgi:hypothetical protein